MTTTSPTPLGVGYDSLGRRGPSRQFYGNQPLRPHLKRGSPLNMVSTVYEMPNPLRPPSIGDSSDDEGSAPVLSAEAEKLLGAPAPVGERSIPLRIHIKHELRESPSSPHIRLTAEGRKSSSPLRSGSPRIVRLSSASPDSHTIKRTIASNGSQSQYPQLVPPLPSLETPAPLPRQLARESAQGHSGGDSGASNAGSSGQTSHNSYSTARTSHKSGSESRVPNRAAKLDGHDNNESLTGDHGLYGSLRIKRAGKVTGKYLSGPARRGIVRRLSEEDHSPLHKVLEQSQLPPARAERHKPETQPLDLLDQTPPLNEEIPTRPLQPSNHVQFSSRADLIDFNVEDPPKVALDPNTVEPDTLSQLRAQNPTEYSKKRDLPAFKVPPLPPLPSLHDQENEPPPTFRQNRIGVSDLLESKPNKMSIMLDYPKPIETPVTTSPIRKALGSRSHNTPLRPAPVPPPRMSEVLETATAVAGAASISQAEEEKNCFSVNGKLFTEMECIGEGGSSTVYRVISENYKVFALKIVDLKKFDELAIRGYKGEIKLLRKLKKVKRVVRLHDFEINNALKTLSVLMEIGESDLHKILGSQLRAKNARFDITFTRFFWKEMLECVQAVHQCGIVHSDLKPANFIIVLGHLKIIDFGIADAIQDDTVNVHRENTVGTPNYISPEALQDANAGSGLPSSVGKLMKLGKPSDVWSLGCILYQMVYGKPPFDHIPNKYYQRLNAIQNASHVIQYPELALGGVPVPLGLIRTMKRCLNRDQTLRPTVEQLLADGDPFLHPDQHVQGTIPIGRESIARMQQNIVNHIRDKGIPSEEELARWPDRFYNGLKIALGEGRGKG